MTHKFKSILAGVLCLACLPLSPVNVSAAAPYDLIITGVDAEGNYVAVDRSGGAYYLKGVQVNAGLPEGSESLVPGDVILFGEGVGCSWTELGGNAVNYMEVTVPRLGDGELLHDPLEPGMVTKVGSVLDDMETAVYLTGGYTYGLELYDDENSYTMITSWQHYDRYERLGHIDWWDVEPGDTVECIVYDGRPVIALEVVSTTLDEDGESDYDYEHWGEYRSVYRLNTDTFKYTNHGYHTEKNLTSEVYYEQGTLRTDIVNVNYLVTGVFCAPGETKPTYYTVNAVGNSSTSHIGYSENVAASELERYLGDQILEIGDLLYIDIQYYSGHNPSDMTFNHMEESGVETIVEYAGNGMELFGEDFRKVLRHELDKTPVLREGRKNYRICTANNLFEKGRVTDGEDVSLKDVVALNKHLMIGHEISYIGTLSADVDNNGIVDEVDSLNILKSIIGLVDLDELG